MRRGQVAAARGRLDEAAAAFQMASRAAIHETSIHGHVEAARAYRNSGNLAAANLRGINTDLVRIRAFVISALAAVIAGLLSVAQAKGTDSQAGFGAELIVMGTHGRSGLAHALLGSVAERVVQHSPCPVLIVPKRPEKAANASAATAAR